jgi:hypothetical protein
MLLLTVFKVQKQRIDAQIEELPQMLNGSVADVQPTAGTKTKRTMSAAGRKVIADAQRKRWAATKGETKVASKASKPKRKLSSAGRAAIVAALKKGGLQRRRLQRRSGGSMR